MERDASGITLFSKWGTLGTVQFDILSEGDEALHVHQFNDVMVVTVGRKYDGMTMVQFLETGLFLPTGYIRKLFVNGRINVQGHKVIPDTVLTSGQKIWMTGEVEGNPQAGLSFDYTRSLDYSLDGTILFEDEHILVLDKPANLIVHPGSEADYDTMDHRVATYYEQSGQRRRVLHVHRLDRGTTGAIVYGKHGYIARALDMQLRQRTMKRTYLAVTLGKKLAKTGSIDAPIGRDRHQSGRFRMSEGGKQAITLYQTTHSARVGESTMSLLQCQLETGRTHQIRVHLSASGAPILGDVLYGGPLSAPFVQSDDGIALHAQSVRFYHPYDETWMEVKCPLPEKWLRLMRERSWM